MTRFFTRQFFTFLAAAVLFIAISVVAATTLSTNITTDGTVGVATTSPWGALSVEQTSGGLQSPVFVVSDQGTSTPHIFVSQKGRVGIGTTTPAELLDVNGNILIENPDRLIVRKSAGAINGDRIAIEFDLSGASFSDPYIYTSLSSGQAVAFIEFIAGLGKGMSIDLYADVGADLSGGFSPYIGLRADNGTSYTLLLSDSDLGIQPNADLDDYLLIETNSNVPTITTAGASHLNITSSAGNVGIGTSSPWGIFSIEQASGGLLDPVFVVADTGTTTPHFLVSQKGRVGIGTTTPATKAHITDTGTSTLYLDSSGGSTIGGAIILEGKSGNCLEITVNAAGTGINTKSVSCPH